MNVRSIAIAVPLVLGLACTSDRSQSDRTTTSSSTRPTAREGTGASPRDPMAVPGPSIKGHAEDQVVSGTIAEVSGQSVSIQSTQGDTKRLEIAPETLVKVDGAEASHTQLQEGQRVRASFNAVEGHDVAVEIRAGDQSLYDAAPAPEAQPGSGGTVVPRPADPSGARPGEPSGTR